MPSIKTSSKVHRMAEATSNRLLGRRIAIARANAGLSLAELGLRIGAGSPMMSAYESAKRAVPFGRLVLIAKALDVPVAFLAGEDLEGDPARDPDTATVVQIARIAGRLSQANQLVLARYARTLSASDQAVRQAAVQSADPDRAGSAECDIKKHHTDKPDHQADD